MVVRYAVRFLPYLGCECMCVSESKGGWGSFAGRVYMPGLKASR